MPREFENSINVSNDVHHFITGIERAQLVNIVRLTESNKAEQAFAYIELSDKTRRLVPFDGEMTYKIGTIVTICRITTQSGDLESNKFHIRSADYPMKENPFMINNYPINLFDGV